MSRGAKPSLSDIQAFQNYVLRWHAQHGRHQLPWRQTSEPYQIWVSEIMLQQTQVDRVIPKYQTFLETFPTVEKLSQASPAEVISLWQGLGYNRRGLNLLKGAQFVVNELNGKISADEEKLQKIPGIGPYTASAILSFAFNKPTIVVETNIRTVMIYHFFPNQKQVPDSDLLPILEASLPEKMPATWYAGLMDYGTHLKKVVPNPTRRSKQYAKQSKFEGSNRQVRGAIIKQLTLHDALSLEDITTHSKLAKSRIAKNIPVLVAEGFLDTQTDSKTKKTLYYLKT